MRKSPPYSFVLALAAVLALTLFGLSTPSSAKGPKAIPPDCVSQCQQLLLECFWENGPDDNHCGSVYHKCIARCK